MNSWDDLALVQDPLGLCLAEVGNPNGLDLSGLNKLLHLLVGVDEIDVLGDELIFGVLRKQILRGLECIGPVHQVEVDVFEA